MADVRHPQVGPPPLGPETYATKAIRPHQVTSCLKPNLFENSEAHSPVVTPPVILK